MKIPSTPLYFAGILLALTALLIFLFVRQTGDKSAAEVALALPELAVEQFELHNGLKVVLHRDNTLPLAAVGIWYQVGSGHEWRGRTGLAHLVEHLMFNGSQGYRQDYYKALESIGGRGVNGTTNRDRTNYYQTVPSGALDHVLWLESDRMGWMHLDADVLQEQQAVVKNEKLQRESGPYATVGQHLARLLYPQGHPYSWPIIGFDEDIAATTLEDVERFRSTWYAPNNATLVIAGDIEPDDVRASIEHYFTDIPRSSQLQKLQAQTLLLSENRTASIADRVPYARIYRVWQAPAATKVAETSPLYLACTLLGGGETSPLYRRLVADEQLANFASCRSDFSALAGAVMLVAEARSAEDIDRIGAILQEEMAAFLATEPNAAQMRRIVSADRGVLLRSLQKQSSRMAQLAEGQVLAGDPNLWHREMQMLQSLSPQQVQQVAQQWLSRPYAELIVLPGDSPDRPLPKFSQAGTEDIPEFIPAPDVPPGRPKPPSISAPAAPTLPQVAHWKLTGDCPEDEADCTPAATDIYLIQRDNTDLFSMDIQFSCLRSAEDLEPAGLAHFTARLMSQGTKHLDLFALRQRKDNLGGVFHPYARLDYCGVKSSFPANSLAPSVDLTLQMAYEPRLAEEDLERERTLWLNAIRRELSRPRSMALRVLPPLLYGKTHPYGVPFTGTGYPVQIENLRSEDVRQWHARTFRPDRASLIIAGDIDGYGRDELLQYLQNSLGGTAKFHAAPLNTQAAAACSRPAAAADKKDKGKGTTRIVLIPVRDSKQSIVIAGQAVTLQDVHRDMDSSLGACDRAALYLANEALGGSFTSRYNLLLRESKGWTYGAYSAFTDHQGPPLIATYTSVQADHTAEAVQQTLDLVREFIADKPISIEEMRQARQAYLNSLPIALESVSGLRSFYSATVGKGRVGDARTPNWWLQSRIQLMQQMRLGTVRRQVSHLLRPDDWVVVVVGDPRLVEEPLRALGLGEVEVREL